MISPKITSLSFNDDHTVLINYEKESRLFDFKPYLDFGIYKELREIKKFKNGRISFNTIQWSNEVDIDPEFLYSKSKPPPLA